jgi:hypothetical protein
MNTFKYLLVVRALAAQSYFSTRHIATFLWQLQTQASVLMCGVSTRSCCNKQRCPSMLNSGIEILQQHT